MIDLSNTSFTREQWLEIAWSKGPPDLAEDSRKVLEEYSKIPSGEVVDHVTKIRDKAFKIHPYPCIGQWRFLHLALGRHFAYPEVLKRMLTGEQIFLDLGCAFAQDLRRLVADGVDSLKCYGSDLRLQFLDLGYELFRDKTSLNSDFIEADIFDEDSALTKLHAKVNIINASSFFHLFSLEQQKQVARQVLKLWTGQPGDLLIGRQVGNDKAEEITTRAGGSLVFRHNTDSWKQMWEEIGTEAGLQFQVESVMETRPNMTGIGHIFGRPEGTKILSFSVERVA